MTIFTSDRERSLWLWTATVLIAIYASLGPARVLVDALRERNLLRASFVVLVVVMLVLISRQWIKQRPGWSEIGVALGVGLAYGFTFLRMENPAERTHLIEYGIVAALVHQALLERQRNGRPVADAAAVTVVATAMLGLLDEGIQAVLPMRVFDWVDVFFNAFAGFMVIVARLALAPVGLPGWRLWFLWLMSAALGWGWSMDPSVFGEPLPISLPGSLPEMVIPYYINVALGGILVAVMQWLILRRYLAGALRWLPASIAAVMLGAVVFLGISWMDPGLGLIVSVGLYGTLAGLLQWQVLRREAAGAGWWVLASSVAWLIAIPIGDIAGPPGWAVYGAVSGAALVWLLQREAQKLS